MFNAIFDLKDQSPDLLAAVVLGALCKAVGMSYVARSCKKEYELVGTVSELYIYPVKGCGPISVSKAMCTPVGLSSDNLTDRHWLILGKNQKVYSLKEAPVLANLKSSAHGDSIRLDAPGMPPLDLPKVPKGKIAMLGLKYFEGQDIPMIDCGKEAEDWISKYLGKPVNLYYSSAEIGTRDVYERKRPWKNTARKGDKTVFNYFTSYLVASTASLDDINSRLENPVKSVNFRPNIVIKNSLPFDEDNWKELRIGNDVTFHGVEPCIRCIITTVDPDTGKRRQDMQPLKTLKQYRCREPYGNSPVYGNYMSTDAPGAVAVGDPVYALR